MSASHKLEGRDNEPAKGDDTSIRVRDQQHDDKNQCGEISYERVSSNRS
jgi:hypothetical protein